ncbi:hypothetical protein FACS189432_02420 [Bacteroidia bacterium]|nr:hypothetical protein FACS189426_00480 [Bacteroidia bacterium]GHT26959.1 hypothetical protein FACS189432_02420 [Bacteroidia bacterium]
MKVVFLSTFALDANVSLIRELQKTCDIYFFYETLHLKYTFLDKEKLSKLLTVGTEVEEMQRFARFVPLNKTYIVKGVRNSQFFKKIWHSYKIHLLVKKIKPDVVLSDSYQLTYLLSEIAYRKKTLLLVHDPFVHSGEQSVSNKLLRKIFFSMIPNKMLLNEKQKQKFITTYNQGKNQTFSSFLGMYEYLTCFTTEQTKNDNKFDILFFGRISPYKGIKYLLDAFVLITEQRKYNDITLTVAGSGDFDFDIYSYEKYNNIKIINRYIQVDELANLINASSVVICPYTDATQSGVVMSAFAFKKPVIATKVGGLPEMIADGQTGVLIAPKNVSEIKDAILTLYNDRNLLKTMEKNIKKEYFSEGKRTWKVAASYFMEAFNKMIQ